MSGHRIVLHMRPRWRARLWLLRTWRSRRQATRQWRESMDPARFHQDVERLRRDLGT